MPLLYFLNTSALVPRYVTREPGHAWVELLCAPDSGNTIAIAAITGAELAAALNQMARGGTLRKKRCRQALAEFWRQLDSSQYLSIAVTSAIIRRAATLCDSHSLRGYDAVQLACALAAREAQRVADVDNAANGRPLLGDPIFLTEDNRLATAATAEGFAVDSPLSHP
jgi:predicted nucleic acid-binding protein